ncbi:TPA: Abi family protein [Streptococcus pyogenes]|uniref:Abi family protein n=1 Tax=Streptococcus pyogenes TaxID=1314 RepID=UPI000D70A321|nr:Abi family protein [Streptococcus pyogenes]PWV35295.1 DNA-binding protein [Streptococcus pyogenes]VGS05782.1 Abi family protein [Streptococcus pyogenes]VGS45269.1 Abi family protein [Streptococcus pyogenes]VHE83408.1 Abi family protein [Streptococcus pyogenes]VHF34137.1 Abi family protein [Streptococcus pyogenes]
MTEKGQTINGLMRHIRSNHKITISGASQKRALRNMGYFHGYKAYRFVKIKNQVLNFKQFEEVKLTYEFDNSLKTILYPIVMKLETAINNYVIEEVVANSETDIENIFKKKLNHHNDFIIGSPEYKKEMGKRLQLKGNIERTIGLNYGKSPIIQHYLHQNSPIPIWAIFEHTTLGDLGSFIERMNNTSRESLQKEIGIYDTSLDSGFQLLSKHIYLIKDLRNAIAHNSPIFDCRFNSGKASKKMIKHIEKVTEIKNINFKTITDYLILCSYYLKILKFSKNEIKGFIRQFEKTVEEFASKISNQQNVHKILGVDVNSKISKLYLFI